MLTVWKIVLFGNDNWEKEMGKKRQEQREEEATLKRRKEGNGRERQGKIETGKR